MTRQEKQIARLLSGTADRSFPFDDLCTILRRLGFAERRCAADGPTYRAALEAAEVVIGEWIETAREFGRDIPTPRGRLRYA